MKARLVISAAVCGALLVGCVDESSPETTTTSIPSQSLSHVGTAVLQALNAYESERGSTWNLRWDTGFDHNWVVQTPDNHWGAPVANLKVATCTTNCDADFKLQRCDVQADCTGGGICRRVESSVSRPGQAPARMCAGHSDSIYDEIYLGIIQAERFVDITSLTPADERFEAAIRNALTYLSTKEIDIDVRLLFGNIIGMTVDTDDVLARLTRDLPWYSDVTVSVGAYRKGLTSWNHAKIVAVDGEWLLQGGHNMWTRDYLEDSPIHDVSMITRGGVAVDAHRFADRLWSYACQNPWFTGWNTRSAFPWWAPDCPRDYHGGEPTAEPGAAAFSLGRLGAIGPDPADDALLAAMAAATTSIKLSLQDIGPIAVAGITIGGWPEDLLRELGNALLRGVDVRIVLSNPGAAPDGKSGASAGYANGWTTQDVADQIRDWLNGNAAPGVDVDQAMCDHLSVANLRVNGFEDTWDDGSGIGNHAKFFIVDDTAFYMGSQNLYDSDLAELGLLVDDATATAGVLSTYWNPMWSHSSRTAVGCP